MSNGFEHDLDLVLVLHPEPTPAEREAVRVAITLSESARAPGGPSVSAWGAAGLRESVERDPQEVVPRSNRGATRA